MAETTWGNLVKEAQAAGSFTDTLPEGDFVLEVVRANADHKEGKAPRIGIQWKIIGSEYDESDVGRKAWQNLYFSEKAAPISLRFLGDLGLSDEFIASTSGPDQLAEALTGIRVFAEVGTRTWGKDGDRVDNTFKVNEVIASTAVASTPTAASEPEEEPY